MEEKLMDKFIGKEIDKEEELVIPDSISIKLSKAYEAIRQDNIPKKHKKNYKFKKIAVAASLVFIIFSTIVANPALAENVPGLNQLSNYLKSIYWFNDNYISNADKINITQKDKGIEINLEGVIYDESSLKFIYTLTSEKKLQWGVQLRNNNLKINGKNIEGNSKRIKSDDEKMSNDDDEQEKYAVITTFDISDLKLDDKVDIDWTINEIHTWDGNYENGNWRFNFKTSKEALKASSKVVDANYSTEIEGYKYSIDKIIFTPTEIKMKDTEDERLVCDVENAYKEWEKNKTNKELKERLDKLKKIQRRMDLFGMDIMDEKGNNLIQTHGYGSTVEGSVCVFRPLSEIPEKIIFTPTDEVETEDGEIYSPVEYQYIPLKDIKTPFEYVQGDNMDIIINSIENKNGKTKINATFKGDFIASRVNKSFQILPKGIKYPARGDNMSAFYDLLDSINATNSKEIRKYSEEANNTNNTFDYEYELKENEEYNLVFEKIPSENYRKDKQFSIDIK